MVYGLQARYLVDFPLDLTTVQVVLIIALQLTGFYIFRSANSLKNKFRTNPNDPALKGQLCPKILFRINEQRTDAFFFLL